MADHSAVRSETGEVVGVWLSPEEEDKASDLIALGMEFAKQGAKKDAVARVVAGDVRRVATVWTTPEAGTSYSLIPSPLGRPRAPQADRARNETSPQPPLVAQR